MFCLTILLFGGFIYFPTQIFPKFLDLLELEVVLGPNDDELPQNWGFRGSLLEEERVGRRIPGHKHIVKVC